MKSPYLHFSVVCLLAINLTSCKDDVNASFTASDTDVVIGEVVSFVDNSTEAYGHVWDFGDGEWSTAINPTHVYGNDGDYQVTLQVNDAKGKTFSISAPMNIVVRPDTIALLREAEQEEKDEVILQMIGLWDLRTIQTTTTGGSFDSKSYSRSEAEFNTSGDILHENDLGNVSIGSFNVINSEYITLYYTATNIDGDEYNLSGIFRIDDLDDRTMKLVQSYNFNTVTNTQVSVEFRR